MIEHDGCVGCKYEHEDEASPHCDKCTQNSTDKYMPVSNADRIRGMSDEELAKFIKHLDSGLDEICDIQDISQDGNGCDRHENCYACYLDWLKQPAKEEHHEAD